MDKKISILFCFFIILTAMVGCRRNIGIDSANRNNANENSQNNEEIKSSITEGTKKYRDGGIWI